MLSWLRQVRCGNHDWKKHFFCYILRKRFCWDRFNMIYYLLLLSVLPSLIAADVDCPDGKISCPIGMKCCFLAGQYSCCDEENGKTIQGLPSFISNTTDVQHADSPNPYDYCPYTTGQQLCCDPSRGCIAYSECCGSIKCCISGSRCCNGGDWCCMKPYRCGSSFMTCRSTGFGLYPAIGTIAMLALSSVLLKL